MSDRLGYHNGERAAAGGGTSPTTLLMEVGPVSVDEPRDRGGSFEPAIAPRHVWRIEGFHEAVISLYAKGLTTGEIRSHLEEIYRVNVSRELISKVTDRVVTELAEWQNQPLDKSH